MIQKIEIVKDQSILMQEGKKSDYVYLVMKGRVNVYKHTKKVKFTEE